MVKTVPIVLFFTISLSISAFSQDIPNQGYYAGHSILYPYKPVYCPRDDGKGQCYGSSGDLNNLPLSAPLPSYETWCEYASHENIQDITQGWYQWKPRDVPAARREYLGNKICYFEDRGTPKNINDLEK